MRYLMSRFVWLLATLCCVVGWVEQGVLAEGLPPAVLEKVKNATAFLRVESYQDSSRGSAFLVSPELLVTNAHVIGATKEQPKPADRIIAVLFSGSPREISVSAKVLAVDITSDLAFLEIPKQANTQGLELVPSKEIRETLAVYIVGFPLGEALDINARNPSVTIAAGTVSSLRRDRSENIEDIQIDGNIIPGNSGGPIVDDRGRVVAVSAATILGTGIGFSIPADVVVGDLEGRIHQSSIEHDSISEDIYRLRVKVRTIDPTRQIKSVGLYYWNSVLDTARPVDPITKVETHGAPGDGKRMVIRLTYDATADAWIGEISNVQVKSNEDFWLQPAIQHQKGVKLVNANNYAPILRRKSDPAKPVDETTTQPKTETKNPINATFANRPMTKDELASIQKSLTDRFTKTPDRKPLDAVGSEPSQDVSVRVQRDGRGYPYSLVESNVEKIKLGSSKLLQMVADPRGIALYAIFENKSAVVVFDTLDMSVIEEIPVARFPVSMGCNELLLAVACSDSKLVTLVDLENRKIVRSVKVKEDPSMEPRTIASIAPDGSFVTIWSRPQGPMFAYLVGLEGAPFCAMYGGFEWCAFPSKSEFVWAQNGFSGSPSGVGKILEYKTSETGYNVRTLTDITGLNKFSFNSSCGAAVPSSNGRSLLLPVAAKQIANVSIHDDCRTLVLSLDLKNILLEWPGLLVAEYPSAQCVVTIRGVMVPKTYFTIPEILFVSPTTGRIIRQIKLTGLDSFGHCYEFHHSYLQPKTAFIPGREIFLYQDHQATAAGNGEVVMVRCGPLATEDLVIADPVVHVANDPPLFAKVGEKLTFEPSFVRPEGVKDVVFRLKSSAPGMDIDPETGTLTIVPTSASIGQFEILIVAEADGIEIPVMEWLIEIDEP